MGSSEIILVGIDDSEDARLALEYATREAVLGGASWKECLNSPRSNWS